MAEQWPELLDDIRRTTDPTVVHDILRVLDTFQEDTRWRVISAGLNKLRDLGDPGFEDILLDLCVRRSGYEGHFVESELRLWLAENAPEKRNDVLARLLPFLSDENHSYVTNTLTAFMTIGYRDGELAQRLIALAENHPIESIRDKAVWALVWLGYPDTAYLESRVATRLAAAPPVTTYILQCGRRLASLNLLDEYIRLLSATDAGTDTCIQVLYVLAETAYEHVHVAAAVWNAVLQKDALTRQNARPSIGDVLDLHSNITRKIADGHVVDYFLQRLAPVEPAMYREDKVGPHYYPYLRLADLHEPEHLASFSASLERVSQTQRVDILSAIRQDVTLDTESAAMWETPRSMLREQGWNVALCLDLPETHDWIVAALEETSPFAAADTCRLAGYARVSMAVPKLGAIVSRDDWDREGGTHITLGLAAIEALGNIGTVDAFNALMQSKVSFENRLPGRSIPDTTPRDYATAIASCVRGMENVGPLVDALDQGPTEAPRQWISCALALQDVAYYEPSLVAPFRLGVFNMLMREDIAASEYCHFLTASIGLFERDATVEGLLRTWARGESPNAIDALEALAHWCPLDLDNDLLRKIGLTMNNIGAWRVDRPLGHRQAFIVGLLYRADPGTYTLAMCDIIERGNYHEAIQVLQQLNTENAPPLVVDALAARARRVNNRYESESAAALWKLRQVDPERFVAEFPSDRVAEWHSDARAAVALNYGELDARAAENPLAAFLVDDAYEVRRIAARSLAIVAYGRLDREVMALASSPDSDARAFGIEAAAWISDASLFIEMLERARHDIEPSVRAAAREAERERRRARIAVEYIDHVLRAPDDRLLATWKYAQALINVGDDWTVQLLSEASHQANCRPNRRSYLLTIEEQVQKGWKEWKDKRKQRLED